MEGKKMKEDTTYNGWKNRQTWNVALWIGNDEPLYRAAVEFVKAAKRKRGVYSRFIRYMGLECELTPDNIKWLGSRLAYRELDDMMMELID
jgi:hypothetical protein